MAKDQPRRKSTARRYTPEEKVQAVRLVRQLRAELGTDHGTVQWIAGQRKGPRSLRGLHELPSVRTTVRTKRAETVETPGS